MADRRRGTKTASAAMHQDRSAMAKPFSTCSTHFGPVLFEKS